MGLTHLNLKKMNREAKSAKSDRPRPDMVTMLMVLWNWNRKRGGR